MNFGVGDWVGDINLREMMIYLVKVMGIWKYMKKLWVFFFFRIKDFDLDLLKWCWNENDFVECLDIYKIIFVWKILVLF